MVFPSFGKEPHMTVIAYCVQLLAIHAGFVAHFFFIILFNARAIIHEVLYKKKIANISHLHATTTMRHH